MSAPRNAGGTDGARQRCSECGGQWQWNARKRDGMWEHDWGSCKGWERRFPELAARMTSPSLFDVSVRPVEDVTL